MSLATKSIVAPTPKGPISWGGGWGLLPCYVLARCSGHQMWTQSTRLANETIAFSTCHGMACTQILVHNWGSEQLGFWHYFADGLNQAMII